MSYQLTTFANFKQGTVNFGDVKRNKNSASSTLYIDVKGGKCFLKSPKMNAPFGASSYQDSNKYSLNLRLSKADSVLSSFTEEVLALENRLVDHMASLPKKILVDLKLMSKSKSVSRDALEDKLCSAVKGQDSDYDPTLNTKFPGVYNCDTFYTKFFNTKKQPMVVDTNTISGLLPKNSTVRCVLHLASVWVVGGKFGMTMRQQQIVVEEKPDLDECLLDMSDSEDEEEEEKKQAATELPPQFDDEDSDEETA